MRQWRFPSWLLGSVLMLAGCGYVDIPRCYNLDMGDLMPNDGFYVSACYGEPNFRSAECVYGDEWLCDCYEGGDPNGIRFNGDELAELYEDYVEHDDWMAKPQAVNLIYLECGWEDLLVSRDSKTGL